MCAPSPLCSDFPPAPPDFPPVFPDFDDPPNPPSINVPTSSSCYGGWPEQLFSGRFIETYEGCAEVSYPWHPTSPGHTLVVSSDSSDPPKQSLITSDPSPDLPDLRICIPEPSAVSLNPCTLSPISIWPNRPFPSPTTSPRPVQQFLVMLTLSNLIFCTTSPRPLPNASGSFPEPSPMLSDWYLARTTSLKPYRPSPVILTYADLPKPISLL